MKETRNTVADLQSPVVPLPCGVLKKIAEQCICWCDTAGGQNNCAWGREATERGIAASKRSTYNTKLVMGLWGRQRDRSPGVSYRMPIDVNGEVTMDPKDPSITGAWTAGTHSWGDTVTSMVLDQLGCSGSQALKLNSYRGSLKMLH